MVQNKWTGVVIAASVAIGFAACGGGDNGDDGGVTVDTTGPATGDDDGDDATGMGPAGDDAMDDGVDDGMDTMMMDDGVDDGVDDGTDDTTTGPGGDCDPPCMEGEMCIAGNCVGGNGDDRDPNYPNPDGSGCPPTHIDGTQAGFHICLAPCMEGADPVAMCPQPSSGMAVAVCGIITQQGSNDPCDTPGDPCETKGEVCTMIDGMPMPVCSFPPSHCAVVCQAQGMMLACPDGMECTGGAGMNLCEYP
jgi:hypothetical protein